MGIQPQYMGMRPVRFLVSVEAFEEGYRRHRIYLTDRNDPKPWKFPRFEEWAPKVPPAAIHAPVVLFVMHPGGVQVRFLEGRHRYATLRDAGVKDLVCVSWGRKSLWFGIVSGIIKQFIDNPGYIKPVKLRNVA